MRVIRFILLLIAVTAGGRLSAGEPAVLREARAVYQRETPQPSEADRERYVTRLVRLREMIARKKGDWQAIDAEVKRHPAPAESDPAVFAALLVGSWRSPRHDYIYHSDGTWSVADPMPGNDGSAVGRWRIEGNQCIESYASGAPMPRRYTILLLTGHDHVVTDGESVFYRVRIAK